MDRSKKVIVDEPAEGFTIVGAGLCAESREIIHQALPECHVLASELGSWQVARFCNLVGPVIMIVDYDSLLRLEASRVPVIEYLSTVQVLVLCRKANEDVFRVALS